MTPCSACGAASRPSTTNSETPGRNAYERISICKSPEVSTVRTHRRDGGQRRRHGPLELVDAHPVWIARDHVLAGPWGVGVQPNPVRSLRRTRLAHALASSDDGALESDDACRTREVHGGHERTLRPIRLPGPCTGRVIRRRRAMRSSTV